LRKLGLLINELGSVRQNTGKVIEMLIAYLDLIAGDPDREDVDQDGEGEDAQPSLGWFDRMADQTKSWQTRSPWVVDIEQDDCDREDDDPNEDKQQPPEMSPCA
jgi:hypothetical protein